MTKEDFDASMEALRQAHERAMASPEYARQMLVEEGVIDENGELTEFYAQNRRAITG